MLVLGSILSFFISYLIADIWSGGWDRSLQKTIDAGNSFKLVLTPYQERVLKRTLMITPFILILAVVLYRL